MKVNEGMEIEALIKWLRVPPKYTILRVNEHLTTRESLIAELHMHLEKSRCKLKKRHKYNMYV